MCRVPSRYLATLHTTFAGLETVFAASEQVQQSSPFQSRFWLEQWYGHFASSSEVEPVLVEVCEAATGALAYLLPLIRHRVGGLLRIEFADLDVTDYNLPVLGPAAPASEADCRAAWDAVSLALPAADLCVFEKMPAKIGARDNPVMSAIGGDVSHMIGSYVQIDGAYEDWLQSIGRHSRKEFGRFWRVFTRTENTRFVRAKSADEARPILEWIERQQSERAIEVQNPDYKLDIPQYQQFYRQLVAAGAMDDRIIVTALMAGDEVVAALYAISDGTHYAMVRIATAGGEWANCSPGRLIIERSMAALYAEGYRWFDFTTGDYAYKRTFRTVHIPLHSLTMARSIRGLPYAGLAITKAFVKQRPALANLARRLLEMSGRKPHQSKPEPEQIAS